MDKKEFRKTFMDGKKSHMHGNEHHSDTYSNDIALNADIKITVPKPFKFEEREKQREEERNKSRLNRSASVGEHSLSEFKFRAK